MQAWIARQNIRQFRQQIAGETDPLRIARLEEMLRSERLKLFELGDPPHHDDL